MVVIFYINSRKFKIIWLIGKRKLHSFDMEGAGLENKSVVERSGGALPTRVRLPSGADAGVAPGFIPRGVPGCVRVCACTGVWCV